jgi:hypothetical protein
MANPEKRPTSQKKESMLPLITNLFFSCSSSGGNMNKYLMLLLFKKTKW